MPPRAPASPSPTWTSLRGGSRRARAGSSPRCPPSSKPARAPSPPRRTRRSARCAILAARLGSIVSLAALGRWQEALDLLGDEAQLQGSRKALSERAMALPILCEQGRLEEAGTLFREEEWQRNAEQADLAAAFAAVEARIRRADRRQADALAAAERGLTPVGLGPVNIGVNAGRRAR